MLHLFAFCFEVFTPHLKSWLYLIDENGKIEMKHSISGLIFEVGVIGDLSWQNFESFLTFYNIWLSIYMQTGHTISW